MVIEKRYFQGSSVKTLKDTRSNSLKLRIGERLRMGREIGNETNVWPFGRAVGNGQMSQCSWRTKSVLTSREAPDRQ